MVSLEKILEPHNLTEALKQVVSNKGTPGVDGMAVDELESFIRANPGLLSHAIRDGSYRPSPVKRVYIPKDNGDKRPLGIPTVVDRLVQQAIAQRQRAYEWGNSSKSYWRVSGSWVLTRSLKNDVLQMLGWTWLGTARQWSV